MPVAPTGQLQMLGQAVRECTACGLHELRRQAIVGEGDLDARLAVVAAAPREADDVAGSPMSGAARNVVDNLLRDSGIDPTQVWFTTLVSCRPPAERPPTLDEVRACSRHLSVEMDMVAPDVVLALGDLAASVLYGRPLEIERVSGFRLQVRGTVTLIPTFHPVEVLQGHPRAADELRWGIVAAKAVLDGRIKTGAQLREDARAREPASG